MKTMAKPAFNEEQQEILHMTAKRVAPVPVLISFRNLDTCIQFYAATKLWSTWTVAAARAGYFGTSDFAPPEWATRLDKLESVLDRSRKA